MTGFSISGPLYLVKIADATFRPLTWSSSGNSKKNFFVLWLTFSTFASLKLTHP